MGDGFEDINVELDPKTASASQDIRILYAEEVPPPHTRKNGSERGKFKEWHR